MQAIAAQKRFALVLVIYPYPKMMAENKLKNPYTDFWHRFAKENNLPLVDLSPLFAIEGQTMEKTYQENFIPGDFHWNAKGSARIAEIFIPFILKNLNAREPASNTVKRL